MFRKIFILKLPFFLILLSLNVNAKDLLLHCDNIKLDYRYDLPNIGALDYGGILIEVNEKEIIIKGLNEMFDDSYNQVVGKSDLKYLPDDHAPSETEATLRLTNTKPHI